MNKTPRFSESNIEYLDRMWGIYSGCRNLERGICKVDACWAKGLVKRSPANYPAGFDVATYYPQAKDSPRYFKGPLLIGVGWCGDVIGYGLAFRKDIFETIEATPWHTYLFLTKNPEELPAWEPFPDNCWVGVSATGAEGFYDAAMKLSGVKAEVKFISFEPLLERIRRGMYVEEYRLDILKDAGINWVIIGAQTKPYKPPSVEWVREIVEAADKASIPVFLKDNLRELLIPSNNPKDNALMIDCFWEGDKAKLRQEFPAVRSI
jgi:protein gp37